MKKFKFSNTTRVNDLRKMLGEPFLMLSILVVFYLLITFVIFPIYQVFKTSLSYEGSLSFKNYSDVLRRSYYIRPLINSMVLGVLVATIGTFIGFTFAYAITRTPMRGKGAFRMIATFPMVSPPFVVALACILLFGRSGFFAGAIGNIYG
ncbi:MAG: iron ABC transporter permease, partial [Sphaerochaeta sp.]|nr:iron ABC transporter permease [Sphaerochaeta sp.]